MVQEYWNCAGTPDATGCQRRHLLDIPSLVETRRFDGYLDMLNIVSSKARGEASMSAKNGSIKLVAGSSNPALAQEIAAGLRSEEHTSELQSRQYLVCRLLLEKKNIK